MKKSILFATIIFSQVAFASDFKQIQKDSNSELFINQKTNVLINISSSDDLKLTKAFKKDLIIYLNKKFKNLTFNFDSNKSNDFQIDLNLKNVSIQHFNVPKTETRAQMGVAAKKDEVAKSFQTIDNSGVLSNSVIVFNSQLKYMNNKDFKFEVVSSNYLISKDGINKNNEFISVNDIYKTLDYEFLDFIKEDNFVNKQEIGFTNGLNGTSGFSENNINISNRENDFKAKAVIFALVFRDLEDLLKYKI
ncbi:hypothetical protein [Faecalibacter macacae]|uniref:Periplasmic protein n=1 Tax=Faecalibacter macacae TaxID=1859289 RepID=A0A3L9MH31_9FLAO|nr:hypothetical protein [Faecalibacter macacae]RLZ12227.1 hypothetical protein EAH69_01525 [Faecalibacter macacae]